MSLPFSNHDYMCFILILSLLQEIVFWRWKPEIFDWNPERGFMYEKFKAKFGRSVEEKRGNVFIVPRVWDDKRRAYKYDAPIAWCFYYFALEYIGIFTGWNLIFYAINGFSNLVPNLGNVAGLLLLLIVGLVGIAGRIPIIIGAVQDWFKR